ncbi:MAG: glycosyltransferase [Butyrivibrio sp.]|nr:glycosyltransferase [Ruminococcus flavefaciens]MCM1561199.1 glycosyltransferase [Butyrivibrio sp.]
MKIYITKLNGMYFKSTEQYAQQMTADIAHTLGVREMGIYRYNAEGESAENRQRRFDGMIAGIQGGDVVICQFPTWNGLAFERALVRHIKAYHGRIVIFIHDLEALMFENRRSALRETVGLYNEAEVLIVPSYRMKQFLLENGVQPGMKFIVQEAWDYTVRANLLAPRGLKREIHFAGNPDRFGFLRAWNYEIPLKLYSDQACEGSRVQRTDWMPPDRLLSELANGGFGLVWYGDECWHRYLSMNNSIKLSAYLAAGIPVIVPRGISNQCMIEENHLGIVVDTLEEAVKAVQSMTEQEYREYTSAVARFAPLLQEGYFTRKCLIDAVQMMLRRDMYTYSETNDTCAVSDCSFEYVCVNESYGDNLALSWVFRGEADGFLVCDADSGEAVGEAFNVLDHYLLLKNYSKEARFVIKAYVRTLKGKMILAESGAAVSEKRPTQNTVSLVMPAYNAEAYIARSIDTALAQSFADLEIIIVNDGSTDRTQEVIDWYRERYPQIKTVYKTNGGQASARNAGIEHAVGKYIGFMDNDDMIKPNMIQKLYDAIEKNDCDIAMTSIYLLRKEGYEEAGVYSVAEDTAIAVDDFFEQYIRYAYPVVWNKLYKSSLVKEHMFAKVVYEDEAWTPYVLSYAEKICYINAHLYEFDRIIRSGTAGDHLLSRPIEEKYKDHRDIVMFFLNNGNQEKRSLLKRLALVYANSYVSYFSYPKYREMKEEIERMWV